MENQPLKLDSWSWKEQPEFTSYQVTRIIDMGHQIDPNIPLLKKTHNLIKSYFPLYTNNLHKVEGKKNQRKKAID